MELVTRLIIRNFLCTAIMLWAIPFALHYILPLLHTALHALVALSLSFYRLVLSNEHFLLPFPTPSLASLFPIVASCFFSITALHPLLGASVCIACLRRSVCSNRSLLVGVPRFARNLVLTSHCIGVAAVCGSTLTLGMKRMMRRGNYEPATISLLVLGIAIALGLGSGLYWQFYLAWRIQ